MTVRRTSLLAAALGGASLIAAGAVHAQPIDGLYVGGGAGFDFLQSLTATVDAPPGGAGVSSGAPMRVRWGDGYIVKGSVGWGFGNGFRMELEGSFRSVGQSHGTDGDGRQNQFGAMGNGLYDFDVGLPWLSPYLGVGLGYQAVNWSSITGQASGLDAGGPTEISIGQTSGGFAYQFMAGVAFPIDAVPGLAVTVEYRYLNLAGRRGYQAFADGMPTRAHVGSDANHSVLLGLRYALDAPESEEAQAPVPTQTSVPMPVPAPPAAVQLSGRTYLVFFDWDSAALTPHAREIIAEAVGNASRATYTRIDVTGHADRTGSEHANQVLSLRRANVVAAELERAGLPRSAIDIRGVGDTQPLVPTAAGVRQPENRRVEIVYR